MPTYKELKAQADALMAEAEAARQNEMAEIIAGIQQQMKDYGITLQDLGAASASAGHAKAVRKEGSSRSKAPAKYRGPNGELWSGGPGRKPEWVRAVMAAGGNLNDHLIDKA